MVGYRSAQHRRAALKLECLKASPWRCRVDGVWAPASSGWLVKSWEKRDRIPLRRTSHGHTIDRTPTTTHPPLPHVPLLRHQQNQDRQCEAHRGVRTVRVGCQGRRRSHDLPQQTPHTRRPQHRHTLQRPDDGHEIGADQGQGQAGGGALLRGPARTRRGNRQATSTGETTMEAISGATQPYQGVLQISYDRVRSALLPQLLCVAYGAQ